MKTKSILATLLVAVSVVLSSCSNLPKAARNDDMKAWVFGHCLSDKLGDEYKVAYVEQLSSELMLGKQKIVTGTYVDVMLVRFFESKFHYNASAWNLDDLDLSVLFFGVRFTYDDEEHWMKYFSESKKAFEKFAYEDGQRTMLEDEFKELMQDFTDSQYGDGIHKIYRGFLSYLKDLAVDNVEIVDYVKSDFGDNYTKYNIIYSIGQDFYAEVSFIDMGKRYEWELEKTATTLNEILK